MDWFFSPLVQVGALAVVAIVAVILIARHFQHCPHCHRMVPRAHRGWLRCRRCGRQYHRSVNLGR